MTLRQTLVLLILTTAGLAQDPPKDPKFVYLGTLQGSADSGGSAFHATQGVLLPKNFALDRSYHQQSAQFAGGGAETPMKLSDIPAGYHLRIRGNHYWAVFNPIEAIVEEDGNGRVVQRKFMMDLYCGPAGRPGPGCSVIVDVFAKSR